MFIFCEECGQKMNVQIQNIHSKNQKFRCNGCGELIRIFENIQPDLVTTSQQYPTQTDMEKREVFPCHKIFVVDDSSMIRRTIKDVLESNSSLQVVGEAGNGAEALYLIPKINPDVVTMDINMPVMDGLTTLKHIMIKHPRPVVMISTLTREGASITFDALKFGAVDFIAKPSRLNESQIEKQQENIIQKVSMAANVQIEEIRYQRTRGGGVSNHKEMMIPVKNILTLGTSEGGYSALLKIIPMLRPDIPTAVLVVIYTSEAAYVDAFARYLDEHSPIRVKRAGNHERLVGATCYIASGDEYLTLEKNNGKAFLQVSANPFPNRRGAINMMMMSVAEKFKEKTIGAVLSGAGYDGVEGLGEILRQGGIGLVQDPKTCLCKDMVLSAIKNLKIDRIVADRKMADELNRVLCFNQSIQ